MGDVYISRPMEKGSLNISEEAVASIVKNAVAECGNDLQLATAAGADIADLIGIRSTMKGIKVRFEESKVLADVIITVKYGGNIVAAAAKVQEAVNAAVQNMTGFDAVVNVHVAGVTF